MSTLFMLRKKNIPLPETEQEDGLTAKDIMNKIRSFYRKFESKNVEFVDSDFLELLLNYPNSMCSRNMTETTKMLVTLIYFESKPTEKKKKHRIEIKKLQKQLESNQLGSFGRTQIEAEIKAIKSYDYWPGFSYEHLAIMFDRSKATIHDAIRQKESQVKQLLRDSNLRGKARSIALEEMIKEEKLKLLEQKQLKNRPNKQTNAPTPA